MCAAAERREHSELIAATAVAAQSRREEEQRTSDRGEQYEERILRAAAVLAEFTVSPTPSFRSGVSMWASIAAGLALFVGVTDCNVPQDVFNMFALQIFNYSAPSFHHAYKFEE